MSQLIDRFKIAIETETFITLKNGNRIAIRLL